MRTLTLKQYVLVAVSVGALVTVLAGPSWAGIRVVGGHHLINRQPPADSSPTTSAAPATAPKPTETKSSEPATVRFPPIQRRVGGITVVGVAARRHPDVPPRRQMENRLREITVSVDYRETNFAAAIDDLQARSGVNIFVNWPTLEVAGFTADDPVTLKLMHVPLERVIDIVCQTVSGGMTTRIGYRVNEDLIEVNLEDLLPAEQQLDVKYIADLIRRPSLAESRFLSVGGSFGGGSSSHRSRGSSGGSSSSRSVGSGSGGRAR